MNKQELIEQIKGLKNLFGNKAEYIEIDAAIKLIEQLDEPQKTIVPQFVADWIEMCKENNIISLSGAFKYAKEEVDTWLSDWKNQEIFASAWIFGYEVEKEKRYLVKIKGITNGCNYLNYRKIIDEWFLAGDSEPVDYRTRHTRKELEEAGWGWVFDCEGIEIEEVENE